MHELDAPALEPVPPRPAGAVSLTAGDQPFALPDGDRSTAGVLDLLAGLDLPPTVIAKILAPFPVAGLAHYTDDWGAIRTSPTLHYHEGTDIFAPRGTPVIASADGEVSRLVEDSLIGGNALRLTTKAATYFYYAHLDGFAPGLEKGDRVKRGDVLGFVGSTGNAKSTADHLHYGIYRAGGEAINPVPYLDRWLVEAETSARSVQASPSSVAAGLAVGSRTQVADGGDETTGNGQPANGGATAPATVALGPVQPISSVAAGPFGVLLFMAGGRLAWKRTMRRRRARRRRVTQA